MERYHIKTGFNILHIEALKTLNTALNSKAWQYTAHCIDNLKYRILNINDILLFIKNLILDYNDIFEYYTDKNDIIKICYRVKYSKNFDIILVIGRDKKIITIYINDINDNHVTLKIELYNKI